MQRRSSPWRGAKKRIPPADYRDGVSCELLDKTYQYTPEENGRGMYFHTDCGNWMYSVKTDVMAYHGCLCPRCLSNGKYTTLYLRGTPEANRVIEAGMAVI